MGSIKPQPVSSAGARGLGWVDLNFECNIIVYQILPVLKLIWQKRMDGQLAVGPDGGIPHSKPTH